MNLPPFPETPMLLQAPDITRYLFSEQHKSGLREYFAYVNGVRISRWKGTNNRSLRRFEDLTCEETEKLARNLYKEIFGREFDDPFASSF